MQATILRPVYHLCDATVPTPFFEALAERHDRTRYPIRIGSLRGEGPLQEAIRELGVPAFGLNVRRRQYPGAIFRLSRQLREEKAAIVHAHSFDATVVGLLAARLAGAPFVFTRHHSDHHIRIGKRWHTWVDSWCARHARKVMAVSEATRRIMIEVEKVPAERIVVVYNGVKPLPTPDAEALARLRRDLGLTGQPVLLLIGRLHEEKGHRFLFAALPSILSKVGPLTLLLAGEGPHRRQLEADVKARGLEQVVRFLGWRDDVAALLAVSSILVLPSLAESFGQAITEAMIQGKPVVATRIGGIPELVVDGETGLLVPAEDAPALANAVQRLLTNPAEVTAFAEAGRRRAELFSYERMLRGYERVYDEVLGAPAQRHTPIGVTRQ